MEGSHDTEVDGKSFEQLAVWMIDQKKKLETGLDDGELSPQQAERQWQQIVETVERAGLGELIEATDPDCETIWIDDDEYYRVDKNSKTYHASAGKTVVNRSVYRKRGEHNGRLVCPVELRWGMVGGRWTPYCARQMSFLGQNQPYGQATKLAEEMGRLTYSRASFERMTTRLGDDFEVDRERREDELIEQLEIPDEAVSVSVGVDRVSLPLDEAQPSRWEDARKADGDIHYRMAFCATLTLHDAQGRPLWCKRYGRLPYEGIWVIREQLVWDLKAVLDKADGLDVICLSDGASQLCDMLDEAIVEAEFTEQVQRLIDLWHLLEKLADALSAYKDDPQEARDCLVGWRMWLLNFDKAADLIEKVLKSWDARDLEVAGKKPVHQALTYLENHKEQMRYASARQQGLPVGSGHVEATCKALVEARMKRNGQYWKPQGAQAVLNLRALALSDQWDDAMSLLLEKYQTDAEIYARKRVA